MNETNDAQEKRKHKRKTVKIIALLKMGVYLSGRGYAKDISVSGMCLVAPNIFKLMKPSQINEHVGAMLKVMFPSQSLTVQGNLVWIDARKGEGAISITSTSNDTAWKELCAQ